MSAENEALRVAGAGRRAPVPSLADSAAELFFQDRTHVGIRGALAAIRDDLGFDTASLFVRGAAGWELLYREGPTKPWHGVMDPSMLEGTPEVAEYRDVRSIPGIGARLAALGCGSVAVLPVPDGGRLLMDSARPGGPAGWVERARPYTELLSLLSGPRWAGRGSLHGDHEVAALDRVFEACQQEMATAGATSQDLLEATRRALGADELFLIVGPGPSRRALSSGASQPRPRHVDVDVEPTRTHALPDEAVRDLAVALGASSRAMAGAFGRQGGQEEILLAGWAEGPALTPVSMTVAARAFSTARAGLEARSKSVSSLVDRERARMAYALHDGLTQTVTGAVLQLDALAKRIEEDPHAAIAILETAKVEIRRSLAELRGMLFDLTPISEDDAKPAEPLTRYVEDVVKRWRLPARVAVQGDLTGVPARVLSVAYVVIREALANAAKHADGRNVTVTLSAGDQDLVVTVGDAGRGFTREEESAAKDAHHVGLDLLRRRVGEVGGRLRIESRPGKGTRVIARLPMHGVAS